MHWMSFFLINFLGSNYNSSIIYYLKNVWRIFFKVLKHLKYLKYKVRPNKWILFGYIKWYLLKTLLYTKDCLKINHWTHLLLKFSFISSLCLGWGIVCSWDKKACLTQDTLIFFLLQVSANLGNLMAVCAEVEEWHCEETLNFMIRGSQENRFSWSFWFTS
jgi:hypothetical protein